MVKVTKINEQEANSLNQKEAFFLKYKKGILVAVVAIIVVIGGFFAYNEYVSKPAQVEASTALAQSEQLLFSGQIDKALKGDSASVKGFLKIATDYSGTKAGNLANLYAAICYSHQEKPDYKKAAEYAEKFSTSNDMLISPMSQVMLGDLYADLGQKDKAVESFKNAAQMADKQAEGGVNLSISPAALKKAGIVLEADNKKDEANAIYKEIKQKYVASVVSQDIDKYIERTSK